MTTQSKIISNKQAKRMNRAERTRQWFNINMQVGGYDKAKAPTVKRSPPVVSIKLGQNSRGANGYGMTSSGQTFKVPYKVNSEVTSPLNTKDVFQGMRKWDTVGYLLRVRPFLMKTHPWLRAIDMSISLYQVAQQIGLTDDIFDPQSQRKFTTGAVYKILSSCGGGGGPTKTTNAWPNCSGQYVVSPGSASSANGLTIYQWGPFAGTHPSGWNFHKPGFSLRRQAPYTSMPTVRASPSYAPLGPSVSPRPGETVGVKPATRTKPAPKFQPPGRPPPPVKTGEKSIPPGPKVKERKGNASPVVAKMLQAAYTVTEAKDVVDALWEALPEQIRKATPKTGRTFRNAKVGEGVPYHTIMDRAQAIYKNLQHLNLSEAALNLLMNHYEDKLVGGAMGTIDKGSKKYLGGARFAGGLT